MGAASDAELLARSVRNPGRLVVGPTSVAGGFPCGGVSIGFMREIELEWDAAYFENRDPASGAVSEVVERSVPFPRMAGIVEGSAWDEDVLVALFSRTTPGSRLACKSPPETRVEGSSIPRVVPAWAKILFVPEDPRGKAVLIRRPVPLLSLRQSVALSRLRRCGLPLVFVPTLDSAHMSTPYWQVARLENLTL